MKHILMLILLLLPYPVFAATGVIDSTYRFAWSENSGWINFGTAGGSVTVSDSALTGYAWSETAGWIQLHPSSSTYVHNDGTGILSGYAWGESIGFINFSGVTIDANGYFQGYATNDAGGQISFNCANTSSCATSDFKVRTDWRKTVAVVTSSGGGGGGGGGPMSILSPLTALAKLFIPATTSKAISLKVPTSTATTTLVRTQNSTKHYGSNLSVFKKDISPGQKNQDVLRLQALLSDDETLYPEGLVTGYFGALTRKAVERFQARHGIVRSGAPSTTGYGRVGRLTRAMLIEIYGQYDT